MIKISVQEKVTHALCIEATASSPDDALRAARALFNEFPAMLVSIDSGAGDPVELLTSDLTSMQPNRTLDPDAQTSNPTI